MNVTPQPTATDTGYAPVNGLRLYYERHGAERPGTRPLVLLHGGLTTFAMCFAAYLPALVERREVIGVELQGHGHTADIDREPRPELYADDIAGLLDHLGLDRADLFGFSLGALTTLQFAIRHPGRLGRAVLASGHYRAEGYYPEIFAPDPARPSPKLPSGEDFAAMHQAYVSVAPDPDHFEVFAGRQSAVVPAIDWAADELRTIAAPVLLVIGDDDFVRPGHALEMRGLIAGSQLAVLPGTTHMGVIRRTDLMVPMLERFLA